MFKKYQKNLLIGLIAVTILSTSGGTAYLSMASSQYLASLFNVKPTTTTPVVAPKTATPSSSSTEKPAKSTENPFTTTEKNTPEQPVTLQAPSSDFVSFSLYGQIKPATKEELCNFLNNKLNDLKILAPRALHRYTTDLALHCGPDELSPAAAEPEIDWSKLPPNMKIQSGNTNMKSFLRNATSGLEAILRTNNIHILFGDHTLPPTTTTNPVPAT